MHDEIAHMRVVDGAVGGVLPGVVGFRVIRIDADDVERLQVAELDPVERGELAPEHEMEQLLPARLWPRPLPPCCSVLLPRSSDFAETRARDLRGSCARSAADAARVPLATRLGKRGVGTVVADAPRRDGR